MEGNWMFNKWKVCSDEKIWCSLKVKYILLKKEYEFLGWGGFEVCSLYFWWGEGLEGLVFFIFYNFR